MAKNKKDKKVNTTVSVSTETMPTLFNFEKWYPIVLVIISLLLYSNTLLHNYTLDDETVMAKNTIVKKGITAIPEIMTTAYRAGSQDRQENLYRPLSLVLFAAEWQLAPNQPFLGHLINILLYALTCFLLYKLIRKWFSTKHSFVVFSIALLFTVHPLHTEVVANIKSRDEILGLLFGILSLNAYFNFYKNSNTNYLQFFIGIGCFLLAMLSKESTVTLAAAIPISLYFFTSTIDKRNFSFVIISLLISVAIYFVMRHVAIGGMVTFNEISVLNNSLIGATNGIDRLATAIVLVGYYILLFFFPHPLSFDYSLNTIPIATITDIRFILSIAVILLMLVYSIYQFKKKDGIAFGLLFFGITLSIVSNIFILIEATLAERFMFLPSVGLCIATILSLEKLSKYSAKAQDALNTIFNHNKYFSAILVAIVLIFSVKTFTRNAAWKDNFTLFSTDKDHNPTSYRILTGYANELYREKIAPLKEDDPQRIIYCNEIIEYTKKSLAITEDNFSAWSLLAFSYNQNKDYNNAIQTFEQGKKYFVGNMPNIDNFYQLGANAYYNNGQLNNALNTAKAGLAIADTNAKLWNSYAMTLVDLNDIATAKTAFSQAIKLDSNNTEVWYNYGNMLAKTGDYAGAIIHYKKIENRNAPTTTLINMYNNLGNCYALLKQYDNAIAAYQNVLNYQPENVSALRNISLTYQNIGNAAKAKEYADKLQLLNH